MPKQCLYFATLLLLSVTSAFCQYVPVIQKCTRDITTLCAASLPVSNPLTECVKTHFKTSVKVFIRQARRRPHLVVRQTQLLRTKRTV
jgi:hypothetical protein